MTWFPCCCDAAIEDCECCGVQANTISVTFGGFTNQTCSACTSLNNTFTLTRTASGAFPCNWIFNGSLACGGSIGTASLTITCGLSCLGFGGSVNNTLTVTLTLGTMTANYGLAFVTTGYADCTATRTLSLTGYNDPPPVYCWNHTSTTCRIN